MKVIFWSGPVVPGAFLAATQFTIPWTKLRIMLYLNREWGCFVKGMTWRGGYLRLWRISIHVHRDGGK